MSPLVPGGSRVHCKAVPSTRSADGLPDGTVDQPLGPRVRPSSTGRGGPDARTVEHLHGRMRCRRGRAPSEGEAPPAERLEVLLVALVTLERTRYRARGSRRRHPRHHQVTTRVRSGSIPSPERATERGRRGSQVGHRRAARGWPRDRLPRQPVPADSVTPSWCAVRLGRAVLPRLGCGRGRRIPGFTARVTPSRLSSGQEPRRRPPAARCVSRSVITANSSGPEMSGGASCTTGRTRSSMRAMSPSSRNRGPRKPRSSASDSSRVNVSIVAASFTSSSAQK